ncbi:MAG: hypothetical protein ACM3SQ_02630 [Betaproteobacteria bacterium]
MRAALLLVLAMMAAPLPRPCDRQLAPLRTGTYSGNDHAGRWREDEAGSWAGDGWLGWNADGGTLQPVRFIVRRRDEAGAPEIISVRSVPDVDFAVRCIPEVRPGRIRSIAIGGLAVDRPLRAVLGERRYEVRLETTRADFFDAKVILTDGRRTQVLYSADGFADDPHFDIEWAGDLDRDGRLDLLVNLSRKYSVHPWRLLLSSRASATELVGEAASFTTGD